MCFVTKPFNRISNFVISSIFGIVLYLQMIVVLILATIYTTSQGQYFHDFLFVPMIFIVAFTIWCVKKHRVVLERILTNLFSIFWGACILSKSYLYYVGYDLILVTCFLLIELSIFIKIFERRIKLNKIILDAKILSKAKLDCEDCFFTTEDFANFICPSCGKPLNLNYGDEK